jgi:ribosome recycling factor
MYDLNQLEIKLQKSVDHFNSELSKLRTGKATTQMLDPVRVEAYGTSMSLQEVARVSAPDPTMLMVSAYDANLIGDIEKAIASAGINLQPVVDGQVIRISVPPLTQDRRREMVKLLHQKVEQGRVMIRTIRSDVKRDIEKQEGTEGISEDDVAAQVDQLEDLVKKYLEMIDRQAVEKEKELMTV